MHHIDCKTCAVEKWSACVEDVEISTEQITLGQFLKLAGVADTGGAVKELLAQGAVQVNGRPETRRGARLERGDLVDCAGRRLRLVSGSGRARSEGGLANGA